MWIGQNYIKLAGKETLPKGHPIVQYIHHCVHRRNLNFLTLAVGGVGSGKSWSCLKLAELLDPEFNASRILFDPIKFADMIANPEKHGLKKGNVLIFEEAGVSINSRDFATAKNKMLSAITQTFRHQNLIVFFNTPNEKFMDVNVRRLLHATLEMHRHDSKYSYGTFLFNVPDAMTGQVKYRPLIVKNADTGGTMTLKRVKLSAPSTKLCDEYEEAARRFKLQVAADAKDRMSSVAEGMKSLGTGGQPNDFAVEAVAQATPAVSTEPDNRIVLRLGYDAGARNETEAIALGRQVYARKLEIAMRGYA